MQQRRDTTTSAEPYSTLTNNVSNVPPNSSAIHSYGSSQMSVKSNTTNAKNRFTNSAIQDGFYGGSGYYGKQTSIDYYGKYEVEFSAAHHQKSTPNQLPFNHHAKSGDFSEQKTDFHHSKGDFHHGIKPELNNHKTAIAAEFHHAKAQNFHPNHHSFYNQQAANHLQANNQNIEGNHQVPMQYPNQYYPNEYGSGGTNEIDPQSSAYYEQNKSAVAQANYYENMYHGNTTDYHVGNETSYAVPPAQVPNENCDNFYPQYFEGNQSSHAFVDVSPLRTLQAARSETSTHAQQQHISQAHNHVHQTLPPPVASFNHGPYHAQHHLNSFNGNQQQIGVNMDNSNSSSDFNFLSNLANDFAPEYYQLS